MIDIQILALVLLIFSGLNTVIHEISDKDLFQYYNIESLTIADIKLSSLASYLILASMIYVFLAIIQGKTLTLPPLE